MSSKYQTFLEKFRAQEPTPETASAIIVDLMRDTDAFDPQFFQESFAHKNPERLGTDFAHIGSAPSRRPSPKQPTPVTEENLRAHGRNWHAVTRTFALNFPAWMSVIGKDIEGLSNKYKGLIKAAPQDEARLTKEYSEHKKHLEKVFMEAGQIISDDMGQGDGAPKQVKNKNEAMHYNLQARSLKLLGFSKEALDLQPEGELAEATNDLTKMMQEKFQTLTGGVAVLAVVEHIAESLIEAQYAVHLNAKKDNGEYIYPKTGLDLEYQRIHIGLELQHAEQSSAVMDHFLAVHPEKAEQLAKEVGQMTEAFGRLWDAMNQLTFNKKPHYESQLEKHHMPINAAERELQRRQEGSEKREVK